MPAHRIRSLINSALAPPAPGPDTRSDRDLLARFLSSRDEAAFAALLRRHGPLVRAVCRGLLRNPADADDAFQATFLVLVRRAPAIRDHAALGGWLGVVAGRVARRLRATTRHPSPLPDDLPDPTAGDPSPASDLRAILDEEVARLPEVYRLVVQVCYVTGRTTSEAATLLGWAKGTVLTRLAWARRRLRSRLAGRGVGLAVGAFGALLERPAAVAAGSALLARTTRAAVAVVRGEAVPGLVSERSITLSEGVIRTMMPNKLKWATGLVLVALLTGVGIARWALAGEPGAQPPRSGRSTPPTPPAVSGPADPAARAADPLPAAPPAPTQRPPEAAPSPPVGSGKQFLVARPIGTWSRSVLPSGGDEEPAWVSMRFEEDRLTIRIVVAVERQSIETVLEADYSITKDSVVFGVVTGVDTRLPNGGRLPASAATEEESLIDQPFTFRFRVDGGTLTVKDLRIPGVTKQGDSGLSPLLGGRFTSGAEEPGPARGRGPSVVPGRQPRQNSGGRSSFDGPQAVPSGPVPPSAGTTNGPLP